MARTEEELLVAKARRGDTAAFESLVAQYEKKVYNLAYRLTSNHDDASDIAQEAFIRVYTSLAGFKGDSSFATWLTRIVYNVCYDELRKRKRQRTTSLDEPATIEDETIERQVADSADGPAEELERKETRAMVQQGIMSLDETYRAVIVLRDLQGYTYEEIARITGLELGTVKSRLNRARHQLKEKFSRLELFASPVVYSARRGKLREV